MVGDRLPRPAVSALATALLSLACSDPHAELAANESAARTTVTRFFGAALTTDCDAVAAELAPELRARFVEEGCEETLADFRAHPLQRVVSCVPDGRSPDVMLVRVQLEGRQTQSVLRVQHVGASWLLVSL